MDPALLTLLALALVVLGALLPGVGLDLVAVLALALLVVGGVLTADEAAQEFGNTTLLIVACMFILAEALQHTGAVQAVSRLARRSARRGARRFLVTVLPVVMILSAVMNNTGIVVLFLPVFLATSRDLDMAPSRLLIPLSYAAILGGTMTLVGTTTNLLVDGLIRQAGHPGLGLLEFARIGVIFAAIGFTYVVLFGPKRLPDRMGLSTLVSRGMRSGYLTEVLLGPEARLVGRSLNDVPEITERVRFVQLVRGEETFWPPFQDVRLEPGDLLMVKGAPDDIVSLLQERGVTGPPDPERGGRVGDVTLDLAEVMVTPGSGLDGMTVAAARLRERFGVVVLGVLRRGEHLRTGVGSVALRVGDTLLVQGEEQNVARLAGTHDDLILLGGPAPHAPRRHKAAFAAIACAAALGVAALGIVPLPVAVLLAAVVLVAGGCLSSGQAYRAVDLRILVVLGCMLGVGLAVNKTGIAEDVAHSLVGIGQRWGAVGVLAAIYLATMILTEVVTNVGTAAVMVPIALEAARLESELVGYEVSHRPFIMAVALAASCSFLTPIGYQTNLLIYGPGGYRFLDYLRFGLPLSLVLWIAAILLLPVLFPF